jgi:DNA polymerase III subunit beta
LVVKSTDLEISLQVSSALENSAFSEAKSFLVSGKKIFDLIKELEGDISFHLEDNSIKIHSGKAELTLHIKDAQEFPPFPERIENLMQLDSKLLLKLLEKVAFIIPQNNSNQALNGLLIEISNNDFKMTATNGHCLAQVKTDKYRLDEPISWLIPRRAVFELKKIIETTSEETIFLGKCKNQLVFSGESFNFFTKLLTDQFPEYAPILDHSDFNSGLINRMDLIKTLRRSACLLSGQFIPTQFSFFENELAISLMNKEVGAMQERLFLKDYKGKDVEIRFYAPYLLNGLQVFEDDLLKFNLHSSARPIILESNSDDLNALYLVMPVSPTN